MPDNINHPKPEQKNINFSSFDNFKQLNELPSTKPLALVNLEGEITYCNKSFGLAFGLNKGKKVSKIDSEPPLPHLLQGFYKSNYSSFHFDIFLFGERPELHKSYNVSIDRIFIENKELLFLVFTSTEEKKHIEEKISNLLNALEYGKVAVIITNEEGIIDYSSQAFEEILGLGIERIYKCSLLQVLEKFLDEQEVAYLKYAIANKKEWIKLISGTEKLGEEWFMEIRLNPVTKGDKHSFNFILTANDITNYILKNRISRRSEERQKLVINNISDLLLILKKINGELIYENSNDNFHNVFSIESEFEKEVPLAKIISEELFVSINSAVDKIFEIKDKYYQFKFSDVKNKREYICKLTCTDDPYEKTTLFIVTLEDITEQLLQEARLREAYEKETQLNRLKTAFMANMSHEIRTPLNAIVGYSDLLEDEVNEVEDEGLKEITHYLKDGVKRLLNLVDNIVEVSILESGEADLDLVKLNINSFIQTMLPNYDRMSKSLNITVHTNFDPEQPLIELDESKMKKVLDMLIDNACKYNKRDGHVRIQTKSTHDLVRIEIEDTGIGIDENKIGQLLQPFIQEEEEGHKRNYEGAGLGLTIAYKLTQAMKGKLNIRSKLEKGTVIYLTFQRAYR